MLGFGVQDSRMECASEEQAAGEASDTGERSYDERGDWAKDEKG